MIDDLDEEDFEEIDLRAAVELYKKAAEFVGVEWLFKNIDDKYLNPDHGRHHHDSTSGILEDAHKARVDLATIGESNVVNYEHFRKESLRIITLGRFLNLLENNHNIVTADGERTDATLESRYRNKLRREHYERARYELAIASAYVMDNYTIQFVEERSGRPVPEFILKRESEEIAVECKRCDNLPSEALDIDNMQHFTLEKLDKTIDLVNYGCFVKIESVPTHDEISNIPRYLPKFENEICDQEYTFELPFGSAKIFPLRDNFEEPLILPEWVEYEPQRRQALDETFIDPILSENIGINRTNLARDPSKIVTVSPSLLVNDEKYNVVFVESYTICVYENFDYKSAYKKQIEKHLDSVGSKFSKEIPNILFIDVPNFSRFTEEQQKEISDMISDKYSPDKYDNHRRLSATCITTGHMHEGSFSIYTDWYKNERCYTSLPESFKSI